MRNALLLSERKLYVTLSESMQGIGGQPANVPVTEEELATEVALLNDVVIGHGDLAHRPAGHTHHCKVLGELAAQRTSAHQEDLQVLQLPLHRPAENAYLAVVAASLQGRTSAVKTVLAPTRSA